MGGKKRRAVALAADAEVGSWEWATTTAGDQTTAQRMPPHCTSERGPRHNNQTAHRREREEEDGMEMGDGGA